MMVSCLQDNKCNWRQSQENQYLMFSLNVWSLDFTQNLTLLCLCMTGMQKENCLEDKGTRLTGGEAGAGALGEKPNVHHLLVWKMTWMVVIFIDTTT